MSGTGILRENPAKRQAMRERMKVRVVSEVEEAKVFQRKSWLKLSIEIGFQGALLNVRVPVDTLTSVGKKENDEGRFQEILMKTGPDVSGSTLRTSQGEGEE
ncbi:unnamed protein product [Boreogadus saida]